MTIRISKHARLALFILFVCAPAAHAAPVFTFSLLPESISGEAGATIGWGYSLTNLSSESWLVFGGVDSPSFEHALMLDPLIFDSPILAPGATASVAYSQTQPAGLFQLTWDVTAPVGFVNTGLFTLMPELWDGDPFAGGNPIDVAESVSAAYSATVAAKAVPEPATLVLSGAGLALAGLVRRRRARDTASLQNVKRKMDAVDRSGSFQLDSGTL